MPKYRKKPVIIEAEQFDANSRDLPNGVCYCVTHDARLAGPHVHTLEGPLHVTHGDWIITGVKGERYPCKPDVFEQTYEAVAEAP
jgi:hypothetical protein